MSLSKNMIQIKNFGGVVYEERDAGEAGIYPGMLCKVASDGDVELHDDEGGEAECLVAIEDALQGNTVDDVYVADYPVRLVRFRPGEEFHGLVAAHQTISIGEGLISDANGMFKSATDSGLSIDAVVAYAMEAITTTTTPTLCHMRAK